MTSVSVIVPIHGKCDFLHECLSSLREQSMEDCEFLCILDGENPIAEDIVHEFCSDSRFNVSVIMHGGVSVARNFGLSKSKGKYVCFVDSDDVLVPDYLSELYDYAEEKDLDDLIHGAETFGDEPEGWVTESIEVKPKVVSRFKPGMIFKLNGCRPFLWMHFFKRRILVDNSIFFDPNILIGEDQCFLIQVLQFTEKVGFVNEPFYRYRIHGDSTMALTKDRFIFLMNEHEKMVESVIDHCSTGLRGNKEFRNWVFDTLIWSYVRIPCGEHREHHLKLKNIFMNLGIDYSHSIFDGGRKKLYHDFIREF